MLGKGGAGRPGGGIAGAHRGQGEAEGVLGGGDSEELLKKPGACPKKQEVKVSVKAAFTHQKDCHRGQRSEPPRMDLEVGAWNRGLIPFNQGR